ncbi:hypothetical protein [Cellulomonas sp. ATA003]|nr:hypothetical protein [Cellulomonas sp. ATA003]WNB85400.1 hypothetical protein REH70_17750 [Cellulomonas sp. ATA003]
MAALLGTGTDGEGRTAVILLSTVGVAGFGALLGAAVAARLDRGRRRR